MKLQVTTVAVSNLKRAKQFYEELLGFEPGTFYEPTQWQPYKFDGESSFAIREVQDFQRLPALDIVNFMVSDVRALWDRIRDKVDIEEPLNLTPWGSYKFVIRDPDGFRLGFVQQE